MPRIDPLTGFLRDLFKARRSTPEGFAAWINAVEGIRLAWSLPETAFGEIVHLVEYGYTISRAALDKAA